MRIAMVSDRQCIRVVKESIALMSLGHKITGIATKLNFGYNQLDSMILYTDSFSLRRTIKNIDPLIDIYHVHNEPDWMVGALREMTKKPIVWDIHDLESLRAGDVPMQDEIDSFALADAFVHVSEPVKKIAEARYIDSAHKPSIVLYSYINEHFFSPEVCKSPSWSSFVYEGGLSIEGFKKDNKGVFGTNMRWWYPVFQWLIKEGYNVSALAAGEDYSDLLYQSLGVFLSPYMPYPVMLNGLQMHGYGLVGAFTTFPLMEAAMPNKLFEYISQGVVPVVLNASEAANFVTANECGIVLTSQENLAEQLAPGPSLRKNVLNIRGAMLMEDQIHKLVELYRSLL